MVRRWMWTIVLLTQALSLAAAEEEPGVNAIIDKVAAAYGGADTLLGLENYRVVERYLSPALGQSWSPDLTDIARNNQSFLHDLSTGDLYFENWFIGRGGVFPNIVVKRGDSVQAFNLATGRAGPAPSGDPYVIAGGTMRTTDTLLVLEMLRARSEVTLTGSAVFHGREHHLLTMPFPQSPDLTLYVDVDSGVLRRMTRENPQLGILNYVYEGHFERDGVLRAARVNFSIGEAPNLVAVSQSLHVNETLGDAHFDVAGEFAPAGERIDDSEMQVNRLAENVYHIGRNAGYTIFVDTGNEVIACGGYAGLTERLQRYREESGVYRPLRYQVVSHHHQDHLGGIGEALDLGATVVTVAANVGEIRRLSGRDIPDGRLLTVTGRLTLGSDAGSVELIDVSTIHAHSNLLFYVPATRTLFMADHFGSPFRGVIPAANRNTVSMARALDPLDLDYRAIVTAHSARTYTDREFRASLKAYRDYDCPEDRPLCSD